jgi:hypothetical protein
MFKNRKNTVPNPHTKVLSRLEEAFLSFTKPVSWSGTTSLATVATDHDHGMAILYKEDPASAAFK